MPATRRRRDHGSTGSCPGPYERATQPLEFVRSLFHLATIEEAAGNGPKALEYYRRFVGYWGDGEIDRDKVEIARRKLRQS